MNDGGNIVRDDGSTITVIMPVYNSAHLLAQTLEPLFGMVSRGEVREVIVVDDKSTDDSLHVAERLGARVLTNKKRMGPGAARNLAAKEVNTDIIWFVDADVIVHADAASKIAESLADPTVTAVFGSYDEHPPARNFLSQYKNLVHSYYHHRGNREASTFWAGCGAVRTTEFLEAGGFDTERYTRPSIEDIELGYRLRASGQRIVLNPSIQGTHLKRWSFFNLIYTEIVLRALPWSRLILQESQFVNDLNIGVGERLRAALACLFVVICLSAMLGFLPWWFVVLALLALFASNWTLLRFFALYKDELFAIKAVFFHQLYYLYSLSAYVWASLEHYASKFFRIRPRAIRSR